MLGVGGLVFELMRLPSGSLLIVYSCLRRRFYVRVLGSGQSEQQEETCGGGGGVGGGVGSCL